MSKCPQCGRFLKNVNALVNGFDEIQKVEGRCAKHGIIETSDWEYWDFYPGEESPKADQSE